MKLSSTILSLIYPVCTYAQISEATGLTKDQIQYRLKLARKFQDQYFLRDTNSSVKCKEFAQIETDVLIAHEIVQTGDPKDGIIYYDELFAPNYGPMNLSTKIQELINFTNSKSVKTKFIGSLGTIKCGQIVKSQKAQPKSKTVEPTLAKDAVKSAKVKSKTEDKSIIKIEDNSPDVIWNASNVFASIVYKGKQFTTTNKHPKFKDVVSHLIAGEFSKAIGIIDTKEGIQVWSEGSCEIKGNKLFYKGVEVKSGLATQIIKLKKDNKPISFLIKFLENVKMNPKKGVDARLYDFLKATDIELTEDGHFLAFKVVRDNFKDCHSGTFDNSPGKTVKMDRSQVNSNDSALCSAGLHVCSRSYIKHFGSSTDKLVQVKVHPKDVVSIPTDYNNAKMRTCEYYVVKELSK